MSIILLVHSSLSAFGFLAAITTRLAQAGIKANPVSDIYPNYLFAACESRHLAKQELVEHSRAKKGSCKEGG